MATPASPIAPSGTTTQRMTLGARELEDFEALERDAAGDAGMPSDSMTLNFGPSHPAMHGTIRMVIQLDGERIRTCDVQPGYLHRGFEKEAEHATYTQVFPYTDRLNYVSPMLNNVGYALAVERLLGINHRIPERAQFIRVLVGECSRITDHLTCLAASAMELGGFTAFLYLVKAREYFYELLEELSGARLTHSYVRIGGVAHDLTPTWAEHLESALSRMEKLRDDTSKLLLDNKIFRDRMEDVGTVSKEFAIAWGWTGPCLRSTGVAYDVRKDHPYLVYDRFDWEVPVGERGDCYDRFLCRLEEIVQSTKILRQAIKMIPDGPVMIDDPRIALPPKPAVYNTIEGMINHFKIIVDGIRVPAGEVYSYTEGGNGELGFYIVSDGTGRPYKCRVRPPCFIILQSLPYLVQDRLVSDLVPTFGMVNMIGGECDR